MNSKNTHRRPKKASIRGLLSALMVTALSAGALAVSPIPETYAMEMPGDDETRECTNVIHVVVPDIGDQSRTGNPSEPEGLLGEIGNRASEGAQSGVFSTIAVYYDANIGLDGQQYSRTVENGTDNGVRLLQNIMEGCSNSQTIISGHGVGAEIAGNMLSDAGNGYADLDPDRVIGGLLFGDPRREEGSPSIGEATKDAVERPGNSSRDLSPIQDTVVDGGGIRGPRDNGFGDIKNDVVSFCDPRDSLCSSTPDRQQEYIGRFTDIVFSGAAAGTPMALAGNPEAAAAAVAGTVGVDAMNLLTDMSGMPRINISPQTVSMIVNLAVIAFQVSTGVLPPTPGQIAMAAGDIGHLPTAVAEIAGTIEQLPAFLEAAPDALPTLIENLGLSANPDQVQDQIVEVDQGVEGIDFNAISGSYLPTSYQHSIESVAQGDINGMSEIASDPDLIDAGKARSEYGALIVGEGEMTSLEWSSDYIRDLILENA